MAEHKIHQGIRPFSRQECSILPGATWNSKTGCTIGGKNVFIDAPAGFDYSKPNDFYRYGFVIEGDGVHIRITPKESYEKHLLSFHELKLRLKLEIKEKETGVPVIKIENPYDKMEKEGKLVRLSKSAVSRTIHLVKTTYENPEESEKEDFYIEEMHTGNW